MCVLPQCCAARCHVLIRTMLGSSLPLAVSSEGSDVLCIVYACVYG